MVAASDGELSSSEADRFLDMLGSKSDALSPLDFSALSQTFRDLSEALLTDPVAGKRMALECVGQIAETPQYVELVWGAAQIAAVNFSEAAMRCRQSITRGSSRSLSAPGRPPGNTIMS